MQGLKSRAGFPSALRALRHGAAGWPVRPLVVCTLLAGAGSAWAQNDPNPYYIGATQGFTHNTNINNVADGPGDTYSSTGLVGGFDQNIGRQHVHGTANVTLNRYRNFDQLNNTSYGVNAGWDWQTIGNLSGSVYTSLNRGLANLQNNLLQTTSDRNVVRTEQVGARVSWGGNAVVNVQGGYGFSKSNYSAPTLQASDSNSKTADIGVYYQPGVTLTLGTALRLTRSNSDRAFLLADGTFVSNDTSGRNLDLSANWKPTAQTGANARISWTHQTNSTGGDGFSGLTGGFGFNYMPTGKLTFNGQYSRDAATNGNFYNTFNGTTSQPSVALAENNSVSNSLFFGATYSATAKVSATASAQYRRSTQEATAGLAGNNYRDSYTSLSLGANWAIRRNWSLGCTLSHSQRRVSGAFGDDYSGNIYSCSTQVTLQ